MDFTVFFTSEVTRAELHVIGGPIINSAQNFPLQGHQLYQTLHDWTDILHIGYCLLQMVP